MVGMLLGAITIGDLADRYGRKIGLLVSVLLLGGGGVLSAVSPNYTMFLIMRLLTGAGGVGLFQVTFVLGECTSCTSVASLYAPWYPPQPHVKKHLFV